MMLVGSYICMMIDSSMLRIMNGRVLMSILSVRVSLFCVWVGSEVGNRVGRKVLIRNSVVMMVVLRLVLIYVDWGEGVG